MGTPGPKSAIASFSKRRDFIYESNAVVSPHILRVLTRNVKTGDGRCCLLLPLLDFQRIGQIFIGHCCAKKSASPKGDCAPIWYARINTRFVRSGILICWYAWVRIPAKAKYIFNRLTNHNWPNKANQIKQKAGTSKTFMLCGPSARALNV